MEDQHMPGSWKCDLRVIFNFWECFLIFEISLAIVKNNFLSLNSFCRQTQPVTVNPVRRRSSSRMSMVRKANRFKFAFLWTSVDFESNITSLQ